MGKKNNSKNVSTTRFVKGGYAFFAPEGTPVPKGIEEELDPAFQCGGFFSEDGFEEALDSSSETLKDANGDVVDSYNGSTTETLAVTLIEMSEESLGIQYGHDNVTTSQDGEIVVDHNWGKAEENLAIVLEMVLKDNRRWRKVIESGKVTDRGSVTGNSTTVTGRQLTFTYNTDSDGSGCKDYIENIETPVKPFDEMTVDELRAYAEKNGIDLTGKTTKAEILAAVKGEDVDE